MNRAGWAAVLAAALVVLAGCSGGLTGGTATPGDAGTGDDSGDSGGDTTDGSGGVAGSASDGAGDAGGAIPGPSGSVNFYVSDRPGAIEDFAHLNVTVTTVRFHLVERAGTSSSSAGETNPTANTTTVATANGTATPTESVTADGNETRAETETDGDRPDDPGAEREDEEAAGEDGRWVVREVNATTVDLTRLRGANATLVEAFDLPAGEYDRVVLEVSEVDATLSNGESARVKLPSGKLQLGTEFDVENGSEVDFVYDVMVHKAGKSGKYILRPVLSESGTDQPIERVDERGRPVDGERDDRGDDERGEDERDREGSLAVRLGGDPVAGGNVTVRVTAVNGSVANATVTVNGERAGTTGADGTLRIGIPADADELEIEVAAGDREGELERPLDDESDDGERGERGDGRSDGGTGNGNGGNGANGEGN